MKKRILLSLVLALVLIISATPVFAAPDTTISPRGPFALVGKITEIGDNSVTIMVLRGNTLVQPYIGKTLTVTVKATTRYYYKIGMIVIPITFADLKVGDPVSVNGTVADNVWTANRITVMSQRALFALVGKITEIGDNSVTILVLRGNTLVKPYIGKTLTVMVKATTRYYYKTGTTVTPITFADLKVGDPVSVNGTIANNVWTANRITVGASLRCLP